MKKAKRLLATAMSALMLTTGMAGFGSIGATAATTGDTDDPDYIIGRFQREDEIAKTALSGEGQAKISLDALSRVTVQDLAPAQLEVQLEMRVTRHDGKTGPGSIRWVQNGRLTLIDTTGIEVFQSKSPVQHGVAEADRLAGEWMPVRFSLSGMSDTQKLSSLVLFDYNDIPKQKDVNDGVIYNTGITLEVKNARIVDVTRDADGDKRPATTAEARTQLQALLDTPQQDDLFSTADRTAYQQARQTATEALGNTGATLDTLKSARAVLKNAMIATDAQKQTLRTWAEKQADAALFTADSFSAWQAAHDTAQQLVNNAGATVSGVKAAAKAAKAAFANLVFADSAPDYGDVDADGTVSVVDALMALQKATHQLTLTDTQVQAANVDGTPRVSATDALMILQRALKMGGAFPVEEDLTMETKATENATPVTACNPIDISYMFQAPNKEGNQTYRESADPAVVVFHDEYYLFASHGQGYWVSKDLADWEFIQVDLTKQPQFAKYAPATCVIGDTLYLTHSESGTMLKTTNPRDPDSWVDIGKPDGWMDPGMFYDDPATGGDGYVYMYKGLSHRNAIQVVKLDPKQDMKKVDGPYDCCWPDPLNRGFEVAGDTNTNFSSNDTMEGAWPVKWNGKYYLTCAVPGTQYASYSNNCFVSDSPIGPFTYCDNSPISWKSTGFTQGAGHGAVFQDLNGHWWKVDTCRIAGFERRLVLIPAMFDENGDLYTNTVRSDYPFYIPTASADPFGETGPGWNLLSYGKAATASSGANSASLAFNESMTNAWVADTGDEGEWLQVDLGKLYGVWAVQVNFADKNFTTTGGRDHDYAYRYLMEFSQDGETWYPLVDRTAQTEDLSHEYIEFESRVGARYVRITNRGAVPADGKFAVSGLRIFGEGGGRAPAAVDIDSVDFDRREDDNRSIALAWNDAPGAQGYIVRYGTSPDALYTHYQVLDSSNLVINSLNRGVDYYFTIDAFNESGVALGSRTFKAIATEPRQSGYDVDGNNPALCNQAKKLPVYEAENALYGGEGVHPEYEVRASGATALHGMGGTDTYVEFTKVDGGEDGTVTLRVSYAAIQAAEVSVKVNGSDAGKLKLPKTGGWPTYATVDMPLSGLTAGETNTIRLEGVGSAFHLDWIQAVYEVPDTGDEDDHTADPFEGIADPVQATGYTVYEAENAAIGNGATVANDQKASGGKSVHSMEKAGAYVEFTKVDGGEGGNARLRLAYCEGNAAGSFRLIVNGKTVVETTLKQTGDWNTFKMIEFPLTDLLAGEANTIRLECGGSGYNPDWIQVIQRVNTDHTADPFEGIVNPVQANGYTVYEAENAAIGNGASVANDQKASGGKSVHGMEKTGAYVEFTKVDGGKGGDARLRLAFCEGNGSGNFRLIVNGKTVAETTLSNTGDWNTFKMIEFPLTDLLAGEANTIRLECGGHGYNPDWIQVIYPKD